MKILYFKQILIAAFITVLAIGCTNEFDYGQLQNAVKTTGFVDVTQTTAVVSGIVISDNGSSISARGICYATQPYPTIQGLKKVATTATLGSYGCVIAGLSPSTIYYARAYATNSYGTAYGEAINFKTLAATVPVVTSTTTPTLITGTTVKSGGTITNSGASPITSRGVCYSNSTTIPTIANTKTSDGTGIGTFISTINGLTPNTIYYIRAYATNSIGTSYGEAKSFTTTSATVPQGVSTNPPSNILQTTATSGGNISTDDGSSITSRGVCWSNSNSTPTIANNKTINGSGSGSFSSSLTGLIQGTTYYVRAYATNAAGTSYGNTVSLTTTSALYVGQSYQGGKIAYIYAPGDNGYISGQTHGLIATTSNQSTATPWGCSGIFIYGTSTNLGSGSANTIAIVNGCGSSNTAARICYNLSSGGYTDWYLPSRDELSKLYANRIAIGGFSSASYWSSSQVNSTNSWSFNFSTGGTGNSTSKTSSSMFVRAIRKF